MFRIVIHTAIRENYGSPDNPYWKNKGGESYFIADVSLEDAQKGRDYLERLVDDVMLDEPLINCDMFEEALVNWELIHANELEQDYIFVQQDGRDPRDVDREVCDLICTDGVDYLGLIHDRVNGGSFWYFIKEGK